MPSISLGPGHRTVISFTSSGSRVGRLLEAQIIAVCLLWLGHCPFRLRTKGNLSTCCEWLGQKSGSKLRQREGVYDVARNIKISSMGGR